MANPQFGKVTLEAGGALNRSNGNYSGQEGSLEQVGGKLNAGIESNGGALGTIMDQLETDASSPVLLAKYQQIMGQYTQMISAQSSVTKAIKDAADAVLRNA
jgi:type III secretion apparatus needle protein